MIGHVTPGAKDLAAATAFYDRFFWQWAKSGSGRVIAALLGARACRRLPLASSSHPTVSRARVGDGFYAGYFCVPEDLKLNLLPMG